MKQSTRIKLVREYLSHPLKEEYEEELSELHTKDSKQRIPERIMAMPWILAVVIGILFVATAPLGLGFVFMGLGIANLISFPFVYAIAGKLEKKYRNNCEGLEKLQEKYRKKGLYVASEMDMLNSECGELDDNDHWVCSATGERLNYQDVDWCRHKGNCKYCRKFVNAYLGKTEYWPFEFKR